MKSTHYSVHESGESPPRMKMGQARVGQASSLSAFGAVLGHADHGHEHVHVHEHVNERDHVLTPDP